MTCAGRPNGKIKLGGSLSVVNMWPEAHIYRASKETGKEREDQIPSTEGGTYVLKALVAIAQHVEVVDEYTIANTLMPC